MVLYTVVSVGGEDDTERRLRRPSGHMLKDGIVVYRERTTSRERYGTTVMVYYFTIFFFKYSSLYCNTIKVSSCAKMKQNYIHILLQYLKKKHK